MKKFSYRKLFSALIWVITLAGIGLSLAFVADNVKEVRIKSMEVVIGNNDENFFIDEEEVKDYFAARHDRVIGTTVRDISLPSLERALQSHPAVENAEVAVTLNGEVKVAVTQRTPLLRVINSDGESYYIDTRSDLMPLDEHYTARVPVATGNINEPYARRSLLSVKQIASNKVYSEVSILDDLYAVARYIAGDSTLTALIHQIHVNEENELELFPAVGGHRIILGDATDLHVKFNKLRLFYTQGLNATNGWSRYSAINLKFKELVVCTRK